MAKDKKSFLLYTDVHFTVKKLTDEQAGKLFKHILSYVNDENPVMDDILLEIAFEPIKQSLKRDLRKYEDIREKRSLAGKASADKRQQVLTSVEQKQQVLTNPTVSVNGNVSVSVIDKEERLKKRSQIFKDSISVFKDQYPKVMLVKFFDYWSEMNKSKTKMRFELQQTFELSKRLAAWSSRESDFSKSDNAIPEVKIIQTTIQDDIR